MNNAPQFSAPNTGALRFADVDNESVSVAHDAALSAANWTVEAWVTTTNTDADFNRVVTKPVAGNQTYSLIVVNGEAQIRSSVGVVTSTGLMVADGVPHHIAGVYDAVAETLALYVDGALVSSISTAGQTLDQGTEDLVIGDFPGGFVEAFDGDISDVRVWSDARTTEEIAATFDQPLTSGAPNLELHLRFDGDATDSSGNGRDGVVNGAPVFVAGLAPVDPLAFEPATLAATEDVAEPITGLQVSDADPGAVLTVTVSATSGALTLATTAGITFTAGGNGGASFTAQGTVADLNAALATLTYLGEPDFNGADNIVLIVDDGQADVVEPIAGATTVPNAGFFFVYDFETGLGNAQASSTPVTVNNGVFFDINPNNSNWAAGARVVEDGVSTFLDPNDFTLAGYAGGQSISGDFIFFDDAVTGGTLTFAGVDVPTPTGARDITVTFAGVDFADVAPGVLDLTSVDIAISSEAVQVIPVAVAAVADAAPVITQAQATGDVFEPEVDARSVLTGSDFDLLDGAIGFNIKGDTSEQRLGNDVAGLGDINGDGFEDFIVAAYLTDLPVGASAGAAHVIFGTGAPFPADFDIGALDGTNGFTFNGSDANDRLGRSVDGIGDINSDGFDDILIGASSASEIFGQGEAYIVYGKASGFAPTLVAGDLDGVVGTALGGITYSAFGQAVSNAGDVNGDGVDDLIIGAQTRNVGGESQVGASYVLYGQVGGFGASVNFTTLDGTNGFAIEGADAGDRTGIAVDGGGDINGDGFDDLLIGAYRADSGAYSDNGAVYVVFGDGAPVTPTVDLASLDGANGFVMEGNANSLRIGQSIAFIGDINNDGLDDFAVGVKDASPNGITVAGQVHVVFGQAGGGFPANLDLFSLDGTDGFTINGAAIGDRIGETVAAAGDVNADGIDDLIIGGSRQAIIVYGDDAGFAATLEVSALDGLNGVVIEDNINGSALGRAIAGIGDFNGDGVDDIAAGDRVATINGASAAGRAATVFGVSENAAASGQIQFQNGTSRDSHTVTSIETSGSGLGVFTAEIIDAHDPNGLGVVEWSFLISAAELDPLAAGETIVQTYDVTISNPDAFVVQAITVTINGANDTPIALDDAFTISEDLILVGNLFADNGFGADSDPDAIDVFLITEINGVPVTNGEIVTLASGAMLTIFENGDFQFDPRTAFDNLAAGATGPDSFTYTVDDGAGGVATATANIAVDGANDAPVAADDDFTIGEDFLLSGDLFADNAFGADTDVDDGAVLAVSQINSAPITNNQPVNLASGATLIIRTDGTFDYDQNGQFDSLAVGETGSDSFTYQVSDGLGGVSDATVNLTIIGANDAPVAADDSFSSDEDTPLSGSLFADNGAGLDIDADGDLFSVSEINGVPVTNGEAVTLASGAVLVIRSDGTFDYDPTAAFGSLAEGALDFDGFAYTIVDVQGAPANATVNFAINGLNDAPAAADDDFTTDEDTAISGDLLADNGFGPDADIDAGAILGVTEINGAPVADGQVVALASGAVLTIRSDGTFDYDPGGAFEGLADGAIASDTFTYTIADEFGATATATAAFTIIGVNDPPAAFDDDFATGEDTVVSGDLLADNGFGPDSDVDTGAILGVTEINGAPVFDGQTLALASGALLTIRSDGTFDYDPNGAFEALADGATAFDSFAYTIADEFGATATASAVFTVTGANDAPTAFDDDFATDEDTVVFGDLLTDNGLGPDADIDTGAILGVTEINGAPVSNGQVITLGSNAILTIRADGTFDYDPNAAFNGLSPGETASDSFAYTIADEFGATATATANFIVTGVNDPPIARDDAFATDEDTTIFRFLFNDNGDGQDSDAETALLNVSRINGAAVSDGEIVALPSGAFVRIQLDGTVGYDPRGAFQSLAEGGTDADSFTYSIVDELGASATAAVTIDITGLNDAPLVFDDAFVTDEGSPVTGDLFADNGAGADIDVDTGALFGVVAINGAPVLDGDIVALASGAILTIRADGTFDYDPNGAFDTLALGAGASDSFTYTVEDDLGAVSTATANLTIAGVNDPPVAVNDAFSVLQGEALAGDFFADNGFGPDADIDAGDVFTLTQINGAPVTDGQTVALASGAALTLAGGGGFTYVQQGAFDALAEGEQATEVFSYTIDDGLGGVSTATAELTITGLNDAPVAVDDEFSASEDTPVSGDLLADNGFGGDIDPDNGALLSVTAINGAAIMDGQVVALPSGARLTIRADGTFDYDPAGAFETLPAGSEISDDFTYTLADETGAAATATAVIRVAGRNDAPVALSDDFATAANAPLSGDLTADNGFGGDFDIDIGDSVSISAVDGQAITDGQVLGLASGALLTIRADGTFDYDPAGAFDALGDNEFANDSITYTLSDDQGGASEAIAGFFISGVNDAPIAANDSFETAADTAFSGDVTSDNGFGADADPDSGALLSVTGINGAPLTDGAAIALPSGAILTFRSDGTFDYDPVGIFDPLGAGEFAADSFAYTLSDGEGLVSAGDVNIIIEGVNDAPVASADTLITDEATAISGDLLAANGGGVDQDIDGDALVVTRINGAVIAGETLVTLASGALLTARADGTFDFNPGGAFDGLTEGETASETFTYTISDGVLESDADVSIGVEGINNAPTARNDAGSTDEDTVLSGLFLFADNGDGADSDAEGDALRLASIDGAAAAVGDIVELTSGARVTVLENGEIIYDPNAAFEDLEDGESASDSFTYQVADDLGASDQAQVQITIAGRSDILFGTETADILEGSAEADEIRALAGDDLVSGFGGDDTISGGDGADKARGGRGDDSLSGDAGDDALFGEGGNDILLGGEGADRLRGQRGDDRLLGENGDDNLAGARGEDTLIGGEGDDTLSGGGDGDRLRGQGGDDKLGGARGEDELFGGAGGDRIRGGAGDDTLSGGLDDDTLVGGAGNDVFMFAANDGDDIVRGFQQGLDRIEISSGASVFEDVSIAQIAGNTVVSFAGANITFVGQFADDFGQDDFIF